MPELQAKAGPSDIVQDTLLEAHRDFARFHGSGQEELVAWLRHILLNNLRDFRKKFLQSEKRQVAREVPLDEADCVWRLYRIASSPQLSSSELLMKAEDQQAVERALGGLPKHYREVIELRHGQQLSFEEISQRMGRSRQAVRKLWCRAIRELSRRLGAPPKEL